MRTALGIVLTICLSGALGAVSGAAQTDHGPSLAPASNQTVSVHLAKSMQALTDWRFHPGDDLAYASPSFDDGDWATVNLAAPHGSHDPFFSSDSYVPGWTARGYPGLSGYAWYRTRLKVAPSDETLWIEMPSDVDDAYQVYANGQLVGAMGRFSADGVKGYFSRSIAVQLPASDAGGIVVVAIRFYMAPDTVLWNFGAGGMHAAPVVGLASAVALKHERNADGTLHTSISYLALGLLSIIGCIGALAIYWKERAETAYLWLTIALATEAVLNLTSFLAAETYLISLNLFAIVNELMGSALGPLFWVLFWMSWFDLRRWRAVLRIALAVAALEAVMVFSLHEPLLGTVVPLGWMHGLWLVFTFLRFAFAVLLVAVTAGGVRRNRTEGWITVPAVLLLGVTLFNENLEVLGVPVSYFPLGIRLSIGDICLFALILMVLGLAIWRFLQSKAQQREMTADLEQAQEVQHLLVPEELPQIPGYRVEGTYLPASQVGGDFYQVMPSDDGGLIVLLGDVSGKGLRAAMVVSLAIGAVRAIVKETSEPAKILTRLNRELTGNLKSGFVTCVCTHFKSNGTITIANAGHLAPWVNSEEIATPGMLPLGLMAAGVEYTEETFQLSVGDRVTLLSDGVVESRCESNGALFGFDRLQLLLAKNPSADAIAREAQRFGQEDDISVVSIRRMES
jgi:hypothetical protein